MKKLLLATSVALSLIAQSAIAAWQGNVQVTSVVTFNDGYFHVALSNANVSDTCAYWGFHFRVNGNTEGGKLLYKNLMLARDAGGVIDFGYAPSSVPGTDHNSGCNGSNMAVLQSVTYTF